MTTDDHSLHGETPVRTQWTRTRDLSRRMLLLLALVSTGIVRAVMTAVSGLFTNTARAVAAPLTPNPRIRAAIAWPMERVGRLLSPADNAVRRLDAALARRL